MMPFLLLSPRAQVAVLLVLLFIDLGIVIYFYREPLRLFLISAGFL